MEKARIKNAHGETIQSLRKAKTEYREIPKAERKITVIIMCMGGEGILSITQKLKLNQRAVSKYIKNFNTGGLKELLSYQKSKGGKCYLSEEQQQSLKGIIIESNPIEQECGISRNWTCKEIGTYVKKKFGVTFTSVGILKMLRRLGFSFTRPTYVLAKADKKNS